MEQQLTQDSVRLFYRDVNAILSSVCGKGCDAFIFESLKLFLSETYARAPVRCMYVCRHVVATTAGSGRDSESNWRRPGAQERVRDRMLVPDALVFALKFEALKQ